MKFSQPTLTEAEKRLKDELRAMGQDFQSRAQTSQEKFEPTIAKLYDETTAAPVAPRARRSFAMFGWLRQPLIAVPVALVALIAIVSSMRQYRAQPVPMPAPADTSVVRGVPFGLSPQASSGVEVDFEEAAPQGLGTRTLPSLRTFKERFLERLGQHEASPADIASRPQVFEQDVNIDLIATKPAAEVQEKVGSAFTSLGGFVESTRLDPRGRKANIRVHGKVPTSNVEALKILLRNFAEEDEYYREATVAYNRTADIVAIEREAEKVEESIAYLERALARETDPTRRPALERKIEQHRSLLRERGATKEGILDRVEYVDVVLNITVIPSFWHASSLQDFRQLYVGFGQPTLLDQLKINATAIVLLVLHALSYFFWLIPIVWWIWWRKNHRAEALIKELE